MYSYFANPKSFFAYPGRLETLAMEATGELVSSVFKALVRQQEHQKILTQEACDELQQKFRRIPPNIQYEFQLRTLRHIEGTYKDLIKINHDMDDCLYVGTEMMIAVVSPIVTRIECIEYCNQAKVVEHPNILDLYKMVSVDLVYSALPRLKNLEVLRMGNGCFYGRKKKLTQISENLVEFSGGFPSFDIEDAGMLSEHCRNLKILNLDLCYRMDEIEPYHIARFEQLEVLTLRYLLEGPTEFLNVMTKTKRSDGTTMAYNLKKFDSVGNSLNYEDIEILANEYPNLIYLNLQTSGNPSNAYALVKGLKNLRQLRVYHEGYMWTKAILNEVGMNLSCLNLSRVTNLDILDFSRTCPPSVKCLHLIFPSLVNEASCKAARLPFIQTLEISIHEDITAECLMICFPNVRKLYLSNCESDKLFETVILRTYMKDLQEAFFGSRPRSVVLQFFDNMVVITDNNCRKWCHPVPSISVRSILL